MLINSEEPVGAGLEHEAASSSRVRPQAQKAAVGPQEIQQGQQAADALAEAGGHGGAGNAPAEAGHEQRVQDHVGHAGRDGYRQAQLGLFRHDQKALEDVLQHEGEGKSDDDAAVKHTVVHHGLGGPQQA